MKKYIQTKDGFLPAENIAPKTLGEYKCCDKCKWHECPNAPKPTPRPCEHCYCKKSNDQSHKKCCNCGNEQVILK